MWPRASFSQLAAHCSWCGLVVLGRAWGNECAWPRRGADADTDTDADAEADTDADADAGGDKPEKPG